MVALQIRNVPQEVRDALARRAADRGQSLQAYLLDVVSAEASPNDNAAILRGITARGGGTPMGPDDAVQIIAAVRAERDAELDARR